MAIDIIARGMIESSNGNISQLSEKVSNHTDNSDIHVTVSDKENWNSHPNDVQASGNPVQLDGLQGGVPFSEIAVSGKNLLLGIVDLYPTANGNLATNSNAVSAYAKCNPNTTYTIQRNGGSRLQCMATQALPSNGTTFSKATTAADQTANTIKYTTPDNCNYIVVYLTGTAEEITDIQIEEGSTATAYEPPITGRELTINVNGTDYTITPDSNPYTVPNDIRQQDGLNNISVSEGEISVVGVRKNAAIKRIWDDMGMDLLFDGVASADNPAVIDLANYKFVEIHHIMIANEKTYPVNIRLSLDSYLSSASTITIPISNSTVNTIHTEEGTVSSLYAISEAGSNMNNTKIYGIK